MSQCGHNSFETVTPERHFGLIMVAIAAETASFFCTSRFPASYQPNCSEEACINKEASNEARYNSGILPIGRAWSSAVRRGRMVRKLLFALSYFLYPYHISCKDAIYFAYGASFSIRHIAIFSTDEKDDDVCNDRESDLSKGSETLPSISYRDAP